jgi:GlpG protein
MFGPKLQWIEYLTFFELVGGKGQVEIIMPVSSPWRFLTPIFLHASILHIVFNMLWLWFFGARIEVLQGRVRVLGVIVLVGLGSNIIQALYSYGVNFGGMSGVVYGLLGYTLAWDKLSSGNKIHIPSALYILMLVMMVLNMFGFAQLFGEGRVANAAHVGGLLMGLVIGFGAGLIEGKKP